MEQDKIINLIDETVNLCEDTDIYDKVTVSDSIVEMLWKIYQSTSFTNLEEVAEQVAKILIISLPDGYNPQELKEYLINKG